MTKTILRIALLSCASMAQSGPLANGVYAVEEGAAHAKAPAIRQYQGRDIVLDRAGFAPLELAAKPVVDRDAGRSWLAIELAPEAAKRLEELTRSHLDQPIAVVVGDRILSTPTVRSVIGDGKARLAPCDDEGCETLLRQLSK